MYPDPRLCDRTRRRALLVACLFLAFAGRALADCGYASGDWQAGDRIFHETCVNCHGEDGHGVIPGAPDFAQNGGPLSKPHEVMMDHILHGFKEKDKPVAMPPKGGNPKLTEKDLEDVHAYLHHAFGCGK